MRGPLLPFLVLGSFALSGCVAGIAASAVGAALRAAEKPVDPNLDIVPAAREACTARAAEHGEVRIIDIERRGPGKAVVWGTVEQGSQRRSFECRYNGKVAGFELRTIGQAR